MRKKKASERRKALMVIVAISIVITAILTVPMPGSNQGIRAVHADADANTDNISSSAPGNLTPTESSKPEQTSANPRQPTNKYTGKIAGTSSSNSDSSKSDDAVQEHPSSSNLYGGIKFYPGDRDILALLAYHEGRGIGTDPYCVVQVVLNRCNSDSFPNTVAEVVTAPGQFCSLEELWGQYIEAPDNLEACYAAVDAVIDRQVYVIPSTYVWWNSLGNVYGSDGYYTSEVGNTFS